MSSVISCLADRFADLREVGLFAPQLELVAHAEQYRVLLDAGRGALACRQQDSSVAVGLDMRRRTDQLHLQVAVHGLDARQRIDLVAHPLPFLFGEDPETAVLERVVGDDQAIAALGHELAMGGRNGDPSLVVERDCGFALEHNPRKTTKTHLTPTLGRNYRGVKENSGDKPGCAARFSRVRTGVRAMV